MNSINVPSVSDVEAASNRLTGYARQTPLLESAAFNDRLGCRLLLKAECLQITGSFKFRGAFNKISQIPPELRSNGVIAYSSGNHAQGVAAAAQHFGTPAIIVMPKDAPEIKIQNTIGYGAKVVFYDRDNDDRVEIAKCISKEKGHILIPPYDDHDIIAGQGTIALELLRQSKVINAKPDIVIGPSSGGGMMSGCSLVIKDYCPRTLLYCVEPENYDDIAQSLKAGKRVIVRSNKSSFCDALLLETPGERTFQILKDLKVRAISVPDNLTLNAMSVAFQVFKIALEPSGAIGLAAVLANKLDLKNKTVAVICTGGNVDSQLFQKALTAG